MGENMKILITAICATIILGITGCAETESLLLTREDWLAEE